jgi:menaquinone-dependent protoporphyrinogen oxidase
MGFLLYNWDFFQYSSFSLILQSSSQKMIVCSIFQGALFPKLPLTLEDGVQVDNIRSHNGREYTMPASVLVGFSTVYGSTQEVAEAIAKTLGEAGAAVSLQPARKVRSLDGYQAVVLGAPLYMFRWHKEARQFLSRHRKELSALPVAIFALGPFHNKEEELHSAHEQLGKELQKYSWLQPAAVQVFVGKFDPDRLRFPYNLIGPLKKMPASDERDWEAIRDWANALTAIILEK